MTSVLLLTGLILGQPMPREINLVVGGHEPPANLLRWQLLPSLLDQQPGECLALIADGRAKLREILAADYRSVLDELRETLNAPLREVDRKKLRETLDRLAPALALFAQAARAERCDWSKLYQDVRTQGLNVRLDSVQEFREVVPLFAAQARLAILEDQPQEAVRHVSQGLRLAHHIGEGPTLINHLVGVAVTTILLDQLDGILTHPRCPNLYASLALLPSPFLSLRKAMDGERCFACGTFPVLLRLRLNPDGPLPSDEEMKQFNLSSEGVARDLGIQIGNPERIALGLAIQARHPTALKYLADRGFPTERVRQWPPLLVAYLHALLDYEEKLGQMHEAMVLPFPQAKAALDTIDRELRRQNPVFDPKGPAIPLARLLLPATSRVLSANVRVERRLAALRTVEALRLHAARTGEWPNSLAAVTAAPIPPDPVTGKPFEYRVETEVAILHGPPPPGDTVQQALTYRLKLAKKR